MISWELNVNRMYIWHIGNLCVMSLKSFWKRVINNASYTRPDISALFEEKHRYLGREVCKMVCSIFSKLVMTGTEGKHF